MEDVPVVDLLGECHETLVATVDMALRRYGFFYVANHGIEDSLLKQQFQVAAEIFDLPLDEKRSTPFDPELDIGYVGSGVQYLDPNGEVQHSGDTRGTVHDDQQQTYNRCNQHRNNKS
jgi:isopenicillin N synthase-like dioxygenase